MPRPSKGARAKPGSNSSADPPPKAAPPSPQFTKSKQSSSESGPSRPGKRPESAEGLSLDGTEPFPPGLFRVPVPDAVFGRMPELGDSALRGLLALIHRSFRFDPAAGAWVHAEDWFSRREVEEAAGLSSQGTRNGLEALESFGWVRVDRSPRSHRYQLLLEVPTRRFTYVPTEFLEGLGGIGSTTQLRVVLAVLRHTWGWTHVEPDSAEGGCQLVHDRWVQCSTAALSRRTGRSETAVKRAVEVLQGRWIERVRPGGGAYQYRFLPEAVGGGRGEGFSFSGESSNDLPPDRQQSDPPTSPKEKVRDKHAREGPRHAPDGVGPAPGESAVPSDKAPGNGHAGTGNLPRAEEPKRNDPAAELGDLPPKKQDLAEKLSNVGVWPHRIAEVLSRFSPDRIRANFELFRRRAAEQSIRSPGAWLYRAISEGYVLPCSDREELDGTSPLNDGSPPPQHKQILSEAEKDTYVAEGIPEKRFHRCLAGEGESRFMYFAPGTGGPTSRV